MYAWLNLQKELQIQSNLTKSNLYNIHMYVCMYVV